MLTWFWLSPDPISFGLNQHNLFAQFMLVPQQQKQKQMLDQLAKSSEPTLDAVVAADDAEHVAGLLDDDAGDADEGRVGCPGYRD